MRGGINVDDMDKYPDAAYWKWGALDARDKAIELVSIDRYDTIADKYFWKEENTWMTICLKAERMLGLIKALKTPEREK